MKTNLMPLVLPLLLLRAAADAQTTERPSAQQPAAYIYVGTVRTVNPRTGSLALITGHGMALRVVAIRVPPATPIKTDGRAIALRDLHPGDVVRAQCRLERVRGAGGLVAEQIERVGGGAGS